VSPRWANLVTALSLGGLLALVSLSAPYWSRIFREPSSSPPPLPGEASGVAVPEGADEVERKINVTLFFVSLDGPGLAVEDRSVTLYADLGHQIRVVVEELLRGSQSGLLAPLPVSTKVRATFVTPAGVAYVDLSTRGAETEPSPALPEGALRDSPEPISEAGAPEFVAGEPQSVRRLGIQGSREELLAVYSVVNSVVVNFPAVQRVQILLDGETASTLAGHIDLSHPLSADMTLLAAFGTQPQAQDETDPSTGPGAEQGTGPRQPPVADESEEVSDE